MSGEMWAIVVILAVLLAAMVGAAIVLLVKVVRARGALRDAGVPLENKIAYWGALLYVISPVDLLPDPVLLDDIGVLLLALRSLQAAAEASGVRKGKRSSSSPGIEAGA
ncbi:YkvA family protein [Streptomyces sp. NPDC059788]|uniref:YkvA family protein n=1 Tax=Streptomyces sp. NPDC059788 TaxID=3346948 RepID=UPI00366365B0